MDKSKRLLCVQRVDDTGKFVVIVRNSEFPPLSPNDGVMAESALRIRLAEKYGCSSSEIESLINEANANLELKIAKPQAE